MEEKQSAHIIHHYFRQLKKYLVKIIKDLDEDAIHDFRVNVKKLRAFLRMLRLNANDPDELKYPRAFKKMYAITGKIRDRQLFIKRIKEAGKGQPSEKMRDLKKEIRELADKDDFLSKKDLEAIEENMIDNLPVAPAMLIKDFIEQKTGATREIISKGNYADAGLHTIRKNLKDISYIIGIYQDDLKTAVPFGFWTDEEVKKATDLTHVLGLFNDTSIALSLVPPTQIRKADNHEREHLRSIRRHWLAEKRKLKRDILESLPGIRL
jgi:CHAD domain-containing protein